MRPLRGNWNYPTSVWFGAGRIVELADACRELGFTRPLFVTDQDLALLAISEEARGVLEDGGLTVTCFSGAEPNPTGANVEAGLAAYRDGGCDGVVAFGGGSPMDVGKTIALMVGQGRPIWDFEDREDWWRRVDPDGMAPVVAVPTTSGTGSEVGRATAIVDERTQTKKILFHPKMIPGIALCDPGLTLGLPKAITVATGMDAISHNLEAWCSPVYHPMADGIALEGLRLAFQALPAVAADGQDLRARAEMMLSASMGATAFQKGLGAVHALSHPLGAIHGVHHGLANAILMPYVLQHNQAAVSDRLVRLARAVGLVRTAPDEVLIWLLNARRDMGVPHTLAEIGIHEEHVGDLVPMALGDPSGSTNPVPLDAASLEVLYLRAIRGDIG